MQHSFFFLQLGENSCSSVKFCERRFFSTGGGFHSSFSNALRPGRWPELVWFTGCQCQIEASLWSAGESLRRGHPILSRTRYPLGFFPKIWPALISLACTATWKLRLWTTAQNARRFLDGWRRGLRPTCSCLWSQCLLCRESSSQPPLQMARLVEAKREQRWKCGCACVHVHAMPCGSLCCLCTKWCELIIYLWGLTISDCEWNCRSSTTQWFVWSVKEKLQRVQHSQDSDTKLMTFDAHSFFLLYPVLCGLHTNQNCFTKNTN